MNIILLIHGPNLNFLGRRAPEHYGPLTLVSLEKLVKERAKKLGYKIKSFQSNHEGALIDFIQKESADAAGIIINPGSLTHYSYALRDALVDAAKPCVEAHLSDIRHREDWRKIFVTAPACLAQTSGLKEKSYFDGLRLLHNHLWKSQLKLN